MERNAFDDKVRWIDPERAVTHEPESAPAVTTGGTAPVALTPATSPPPVSTPIGTRAAHLSAGGRRRAVIAGVALLALVALALLVRMHASGPPPAPAPIIPLVSVTRAALAPVTADVSFSGTIRARYEMPVGAEAESGRVSEILAEVGDHVSRGQLLARLDTSILRPQVARLSASLEEARAEAELAAAEYRRAEAIAAAGALSAEEIERRRSTAVTKSAQVKVAAAQLAEIEARLGRTEIRAPEAGLVLSRSALIGQTVTPGGEPLFRLARNAEVEMIGQVAEQDLPLLAVGQPARVHLTGIAQPFAGTVRLLGATIDPTSRLGEVRIALDPSPELRPGAFARGEVTVSRSDRPVLPQTAVLADTRGSFVLVVDASHHVVRTPVRIESTQSNGVVIGEGLKGGELVVATAGAFLRDGEAVRIAELAATPAAALPQSP